MHRHGISTAKYGSFNTYEEAKLYLEMSHYPLVIKASGLAAGKGVSIVENFSEADEVVQDFICRGKFGDAGASIVIEEFLVGFELSVLTFSDGLTTFTLPSGQDHKQIFDHDRGPM